MEIVKEFTGLKNRSLFRIKTNGVTSGTYKIKNIEVFTDYSERVSGFIEQVVIHAENNKTQVPVLFNADISLHGTRRYTKAVRYIKIHINGRDYNLDMGETIMTAFLSWCRWIVQCGIPNHIVKGRLRSIV